MNAPSASWAPGLWLECMCLATYNHLPDVQLLGELIHRVSEYLFERITD